MPGIPVMSSRPEASDNYEVPFSREGSFLKSSVLRAIVENARHVACIIYVYGQVHHTATARQSVDSYSV